MSEYILPTGYSIGWGIWGYVFMVEGDCEEMSPHVGASEEQCVVEAWAHYRRENKKCQTQFS